MKPNTSDRDDLKESLRLQIINLGLKGQDNIEGKSQVGQMELVEMGMTMMGSKLKKSGYEVHESWVPSLRLLERPWECGKLDLSWTTEEEQET